MNSRLIEVVNLTKRYGSKTVLQEISFSVEAGTIFGLIGPSGVGKTTLINLLTGQTKRDGGSASIFGHDCETIPNEIYAQIGMVLDTPALFERLSCYQNLLVYADIWGVHKSRIPAVLEQVGLQGEQKTRAYQLSKGMKQRLILARALLHSPKILFMDEPTSALDPSNTQTVHEIIKSLQENGTTIFLTTHRMNEVMKLCDQIVLLHNGRIVENGNPYEICCKYDHEKSIRITLANGKMITLAKSEDTSKMIADYVSRGELKALHSSEPDLETVFLTLVKSQKENT